LSSVGRGDFIAHIGSQRLRRSLTWAVARHSTVSAPP
jgi:hypothetical protein